MGRVAVATIYKAFNTYTEVLYYTIIVEAELDRNFVPYTWEISYSEYMNQWKVIYKVYGD